MFLWFRLNRRAGNNNRLKSERSLAVRLECSTAARVI
jgi:hypothetical protein